MVSNYTYANYGCCRVLNFELLEFGSLTQSQLMEKVRALQNLAYKLGMEEGIYQVYQYCPYFVQ